MEKLDEEDETDSSVIALLTALCRNLLSNVESDAGELHLRCLRRTAFSHLLNHTSLSSQENQFFNENIPLSLFTLVASMSLNEWSSSEYTKACKILEELDRRVTSSPELSWVFDIGRMLFAYTLLRSQQGSTSSEIQSKWTHSIRPTDSLACIPAQFQLYDSKFLVYDCHGNPSPTDFIWAQFKSQLGKLRLPKKLDTTWIPKSGSRLAVEPKDTKGLARSTSRVDEGFSSPTNAAAECLQQINWSAIDVRPEVLSLEWESYSNSKERQYFPTARSRTIHQDIKFSPFDLVKVSCPELMECIKSLLLGVPSHIFQEVNNEFCMTPGLYTDETPPSLMYVYCKTFRYGGMLFSKVTQIREEYTSLTKSSIMVVIQNFVLDYQAFVKSIATSTALLRLILDINPFISQLEYLCGLLESDTGGWQLLEKLYNDALQMVDPHLFRLSSALFVDCFATYLTFIEKWIFDGLWNPELFFEKHIPSDQICDRYSWHRSYTFNKNAAPQFLPSALIYECGKLVHLVQKATSSTDEKNLALDCRPEIRMVTNEDDFNSMKHLWDFYSHTGDDLRLEALQKCKKDNYFDAQSAAKEKAAADSFKYRLSKVAEREKILYQKLDKVIKMKQQLSNFEEHQNIEKLKSNLHELLEEDRSTYYEIEQMISTLPYRYELIEQYIKNEERCTKKLLLNCWKEKRYKLNNLRAQFFEGISINNECSSALLKNVSSDSLLYHDAIDDSNIDSTYRSLSTPSTISSSSTPLIFSSPSVDEASSKITLLTPVVQHPEEMKSLSSHLGKSPLSTDASGDASFRSPLSFDSTAKSPDCFVSDSTKLTTEDVPCEEYDKPEISATADDAFEVLPVSTNVAACSGPRKMSYHPSPGSSTSVTANTELSVSPYCEDLETSILPPSSPSFEMKTKICGSSVVNSDFLKPIKYSRGDKASNANSNSATHRNDLQNETSVNEFSKSHLHFLVSKSIEYPLQAQTKVMNNLAVHKLFVENDLIGHFKRMRDVFLKNNGCGAQMFVTMLSRHINQDHPLTFLVHHKLQNVLNVAYPTESKFFALKADYIPQAFDCTNPNVFAFLRLDYSRNWPLNLVITDMVLLKYNEVSEFITRIDFAQVLLQQVLQSLKVTYLDLEGDHFTQVQLHRHIMLTFINSLKFYTGSTITDGWNQMFSRLHTVRDPDQLYRVHVKFLKNLHIKLLLHKNSERIQECFTKAIHYVLVYCQTVLHSNWKFLSTGQCIHPKYKKLLHTFTNFDEMVSGSRDLIKYFVTEHGYVHLKILSDL